MIGVILDTGVELSKTLYNALSRTNYSSTQWCNNAGATFAKLRQHTGNVASTIGAIRETEPQTEYNLNYTVLPVAIFFLP